MTKRIPTIIGLIGVLGAIFMLSYAFNKVQPLLSQASSQQTPSRVTFTNVSDISFTVTWMTDDKATGYITYKDAQNKTFTVYDDRDQLSIRPEMGQLGKYTTHSVSIRNATPQTSYNITVVSAGKPYKREDNSYTITTGPSLSDSALIEPSFGTITFPDGTPAEGAIVTLKLENSQMLSSMVTTSGTWVIPLNRIRAEDLQSYIVPAERNTEIITVESKSGETKAITDTLNDNPVPAMVIGKEYDFRKIQAVVPLITPSANTKIAIIKPQNGAALPTDLPLFQGSGVPNTQVSLVLGINNPQTGTTIVGSDGLWRFTPTKPLQSGKQSVTITTKDDKGKAIAMTTMFEILKSGTQVLGDATPSASLTPTILASPTSTLIAEPPPVSGIQTPLLLLILLGMTLILSGVFFIV